MRSRLPHPPTDGDPHPAPLPQHEAAHSLLTRTRAGLLTAARPRPSGAVRWLPGLAAPHGAAAAAVPGATA